ncbi:GNAT family N-acetyltransferase [Microlunatus sp. GCM10028923]|uniref:GNAT family N-acetyltransferase n=1 Tax=Microlunatus sp. GCM10028923 TaxID=3273400 RepID=UPI0036098743
MRWRRATVDDLADVHRILTADAGGPPGPAEDLLPLLREWHVELGTGDTGPDAVVAFLRPPPEHGRGYGAWWPKPSDPALAKLIDLARRYGVSVLQVTLDDDRPDARERCLAHGFDAAFPLWSMAHDGATWPSTRTLPVPLRLVSWDELAPGAFQRAYEAAYADQRIVEPHSAETWAGILAHGALHRDVTAIALDPDDQVAGFVLAFGLDTNADLGPIGTVPAWRRRGISDALLALALDRCRENSLAPITLTVDGASPTGAQNLYLRAGFVVERSHHAYQFRFDGQ